MKARSINAYWLKSIHVSNYYKGNRSKEVIMARGTIINRGTKEKPNYTVIIEGARDPVTGKRRQHWHSGYKNKKEAEQARTKLLHELDTGRYIEQSRLTMRDFMKEWLAAIKPTVRESTWETYEVLVRVHVVPHLGHVTVQRLTPATLNSLYEKLQTEGKKSQRVVQKRRRVQASGEETEPRGEKNGLSAKTVRNIHIVIHKALDYAVIHNLVQTNVASIANVPKPARFGDHDMKTWDASTLGAFLEGIQEHRYYPAFLLAAMTGMRRGEVLGLRWQDVDLDRGELSVTQSLTSYGYTTRFSSPKTRRSRRHIPLDQKTLAALRVHRASQAAEKLRQGPKYVDTGLVFTQEDGRWVHPDRFSHLFNTLVKKSTLPRIRLHDLRHTYATLSLQAGTPVKIISERLGHSSAAFTMDVYQHVIPAMQQEAADAVATLVFGN